MRLGVSTKVFERPDMSAALGAAADCGLDCVELDFSGLPERIGPDIMRQIVTVLRRHRLSVAAVSGAFEMTDPNLQRLEEIAGNCAIIAAPIITISAGDESAQDWRNLLLCLEEALKIAERHDVCLGIEPKTGSVISSAKKARRLLDEMGSRMLRIVLDPANLSPPEAFDLLGPDIALARVSDFRDGRLDWPALFRLFRTARYDGPIILHGIAEAEVKPAAVFLRQALKKSEPPPPAPALDFFRHDGIDFHYQTEGFGVPFFFEHGLGGDVAQPFGLFHPPGGIRLISFDCRAHGRTHPVGPPEKISLQSFAEDLLALMDHLRIDKAVVGGVSMGAAVALNFALRNPRRILGLVLHRPAWLDGPRPENGPVFTTIAGLLRRHGAEKGLAHFKETEIYRRALAASPSSAQSLASQFQYPRAQENVVRLERIPLDAPNSDRRQWRAIAVPTLVMANGRDAIHPLAYGVALAREIPGAEFKELTPKSVNADLHREEAQCFLEDFLLRHF